jgi:hypothetical protein
MIAARGSLHYTIAAGPSETAAVATKHLPSANTFPSLASTAPPSLRRISPPPPPPIPLSQHSAVPAVLRTLLSITAISPPATPSSTPESVASQPSLACVTNPQPLLIRPCVLSSYKVHALWERTGLSTRQPPTLPAAGATAAPPPTS